VRTARVLREAGLEPVALVREARGLGVPERIEPDGPRHPLWGVAVGLAEGDAFFAPVDLVDLDVPRVRRLLDARAVAVDQPLLGFLPARLGPRARALAEAGGRVRDLGASTLDVGPFENLNRPPSPPGTTGSPPSRRG
jgi:hypothetical protein